MDRVEKLNRILKKLYPNPAVALVHSNNWELLVAVQLSAQCTDARVNVVTENLFKKYPTVYDYAAATQKEMEQGVYQCGFYRRKAKNIRAAAQMIIKQYGDSVPNNMKDLLEIPGVARKTANVVLSNAFGVHEGVAVDTHVRRFAIRFNLSDYLDPVRIEKDLMEIMPQGEWWGFNHRLVHYGRDICPARKHICTSHPLTKVYPEAEDIWPKSR
ncbi:MAG: endonuclease III [Candidatus Pacebacteria bacterium]|nr:endonuclease III [Candidatus Paceibacterota bacterium]MCF7857534.1 endonuclease III [Candidatus Paceibacterota bacterium]